VRLHYKINIITQKEKYCISAVFFVLFIALAIYNVFLRSEWFFDNLVSLAFLSAMFFLSGWLLLGRGSFLMFNIVLLLHNLGTFGLYGLSFDGFFYDNIIHFLGTAVAAWIVFNFVSARLHLRHHKSVSSSIVDEHKIVLVFLVIASVTFLGVIVELVEFGGFLLLGPGEGIFFTGSGDGGYAKDDFEMQYRDTMEDLMVNILGAVAGVLSFYKLRYVKADWAKLRS